jgi:hypothetical protein
LRRECASLLDHHHSAKLKLSINFVLVIVEDERQSRMLILLSIRAHSLHKDVATSFTNLLPIEVTMASKTSFTKTLGVAMAFLCALALGGCASTLQRLGFDTSRNPQLATDATGITVGTLAGAAGGALVGAALTGAPGLGAGVGALIGAGAGWAVASQAKNQLAQVSTTASQVQQQQREIDENRRELNETRRQLEQQSYNDPALRNRNNDPALHNNHTQDSSEASTR